MPRNASVSIPQFVTEKVLHRHAVMTFQSGLSKISQRFSGNLWFHPISLPRTLLPDELVLIDLSVQSTVCCCASRGPKRAKNTTTSETNHHYCSAEEVTISSRTQAQLLDWKKKKDEMAAVHHKLEEAKNQLKKPGN
jgi:hypothetical protein